MSNDTINTSTALYGIDRKLIADIELGIDFRRGSNEDVWEMHFECADGYCYSFAGSPGMTKKRLATEYMDNFIASIVHGGHPVK